MKSAAKRQRKVLNTKSKRGNNVKTEIWSNVPGVCEEVPTITAYVPDNKTSDAAVIVFAGGGYAGRAKHEGEVYAKFLAENGITAFDVAYRVAPHTFPLQLLDARRAVKLVRFNAEKYGIDKDKIAVMGSSAGGHLAALVSTYTKDIELGVPADEIEAESYLPNAQILCYPVIEMVAPCGHIGSGMNLLGENYPDMVPEVTPDEIADTGTPQAFIWHTFADNGVHVSNSLHYAEKLKELGTPVELHIFPDGRHGLGICEGDINKCEESKILVHNAQWTKLLLNWLKYIGF